MKIAINGVGVAGPALAYWLHRSGHEVLLVEQSPELRTAGYIIDFWGIGYEIAGMMGLLPRIHEVGYQVQEIRFVDKNGRRVGGFPIDVLARATHGRFTTLRRADLSACIYDALDGQVETLFGDSIAAIEDCGDSARITFDRAEPREVDLVIGADGLHSRIRRIAFRTAVEPEVALGYHIAAFEARGYRPRDELVYVTYGVPGRQVSRFAMRDDRTLFLFVFRDEYLDSPFQASGDDGKAVIDRVYRKLGWECRSILSEMEQADEIYFDSVSQIRLDRWSEGRVALIGDAAACVSLVAGEGSGLAIAEAYVLAGELQRAGGDYRTAFARYEELMMPFVRGKQASAAKFASSFAPKTAAGLAFRSIVTRLMRIPFVAEKFVVREMRDDIVLPDYRFGSSGVRQELR